MGTLTNISDEDLDVALLRRTVPAGETVEVDDALLDNPDLVWPSSVWQVNGGTHEHDPNSPENLAKAEAQRQADEAAAEQAAQEAAANAPTEPETPLTADPAADPTGAHVASEPDATATIEPATAAEPTE